MSDSLRPRESQHATPPCPSPTPGVHSDSRPSSQWCHPALSSSAVPFSSCPQSLPASESFPMSQLFAWGGQSTGVSALAPFFPKKSQRCNEHELGQAPREGEGQGGLACCSLRGHKESDMTGWLNNNYIRNQWFKQQNGYKSKDLTTKWTSLSNRYNIPQRIKLYIHHTYGKLRTFKNTDHGINLQRQTKQNFNQ